MTPLAGRVRVLVNGGVAALFAGRLLADLGADVVVAEPVPRHPVRRQPPFANGLSLRWWTLTAGCQAVTFGDGPPLARHADILIEDSDQALSIADVPPVRIRISPFGGDGPKADWLGSDLTVCAEGGLLWLIGDPDRPPVPIGVPQASLIAGAHAATAALLAHASGGDHDIDLSMQAAVAWATHPTRQLWLLNEAITRRAGDRRPFGERSRRLIYPCSDGFVAVQGVMGREWPAFLDWIAEDGLDMPLRGEEWTILAGQGGIVPGGVPDEALDRLDAIIVPFFARRTKRALYQGGQSRRIMIFPVNTAADILADPHLAAREFFQTVDLPGRGPVKVAGPTVRFSRTPMRAASGPAYHQPAPGWERRERPRRPLTNLRILDLSWVGAGPLTTMLLAVHGADVIRVESTTRPDVLRVTAPFKDGVPNVEGSGYFQPLNPGKRGVSVNLTTAEGQGIIRRLARVSDAVVESFTPGVLNRFGLGYEALGEESPELVMLSLSMAGQTGPDRDILGFGTVLQAAAGFPAITGWPDRTPVAAGVPYTDWLVPFLATPALLAALDHRAATGEGQYLDCAQYEAVLPFLGTTLLDYAVNGVVAGCAGLSSPYADPHGVFATNAPDRYVAIACETGKQRKALAAIVSADDLARWCGERPAETIVETLQAAGVPAGVVRSPRETSEDSQLRGRGFGTILDHLSSGPMPYDPPSFRLGTPNLTPAPLIGQDNDAILIELLGMTDDEVAGLWAAGALE